MSPAEILSNLVDELPAPVLVEPFAFVHDELLPTALILLEPVAFALACVQGSWGPNGPRN
jgi:hypothetical protein